MKFRRIETFPDITNLADWEKEKLKIKKNTVEYIFGEFPALRCPLKPRITGTEQCAGYRRMHVEFYSEPEDKITAYLLVPDNLKVPSPAVIAIHTSAATGKNQAVGLTGCNAWDPPDPNRSYALDPLEKGYVVLAPDMNSVGERAPGGRVWDSAPFYKRCPEWSEMGKAVWDISRCVDYLCSLDYVDQSKIACAGHCFSGYYSVFGAVYDERINMVLSNSGIWTFATGKFSWARSPGNTRDIGLTRKFYGKKSGVYCHSPKLAKYLYWQKPGTKIPLPVDYWQIICCLAPRKLVLTTCSSDLAGGPACYHLGSPELGLETEARQFSALNKIYGLYGAGDNFVTAVFEGPHAWLPEAREFAFNQLEMAFS